MGIVDGVILPLMAALLGTFLIVLVFALAVTLVVRYGNRPIYVRHTVMGNGIFFLAPGQPLRFYRKGNMPRELMRVPENVTRARFYRLRRKARKLSYLRNHWRAVILLMEKGFYEYGAR